MPHLIHRSPNLHLAGPIIEIVVVPPPAVIESLKKAGKAVPSQKAIALIDTGASGTCIDNSIAAALGLVSHDVRRVQTAGGEDTQQLYDAGIILPIAPQNIFVVQVLEAKIQNQPYRALLGRDILKRCTLCYNGWDNSYTLHI